MNCRWTKACAAWMATLALLGCDHREPYQPVKWTDEMAKELLDGVERMGNIEKDFAKAHPHQGANSLAYVKQLQSEGFVCQIQHLQQVYYSDGENGKPYGFVGKLEPTISCERDPDLSPECKWFRVGIKVAWPDLNAPFKTLAEQLPTSAVSDARFICHITPRAPEYKASTAEGIAKGTVLLIP